MNSCKNINNAPIPQDEHRVLIGAILHSCIKDYLYPKQRDHKDNYKYAQNFIFDDNYRVDWGDLVISPSELVAGIGLDIEWIRAKVRNKEKDKNRTYTPGTPLV